MLGLSSSYFAFRGKGIYDSVKAVFDMGFDTVELGAAHRFEKNPFETVKKIAKDFSGKNFTVHGLFPPLQEQVWFNPSFGLTKQNKGILDDMFKAASIVNAKAVAVHPGFLADAGFGFDKEKGFNTLVARKELPKEESWKKTVELLRYGLKLSEETGTAFAVENIHGAEIRPVTFLVGEFERLFSELPGLGFLLDTGHAMFEGQLEQFIDSFSGRIVELHLHHSLPRTKEHPKDDHAAFSSPEQLEFLREIRNLGKVPLVFEHGTNVGEAEVLGEKELVERFLAGL